MDLEGLIEEVEETALADEPLDRLSAAMDVKAEIDVLTDTLIGHFVDKARQAGCSWSDIGSAMGVTKQAAQQRHTSERPHKERPWRTARFTPRAKNVVREAQSAAGELGHAWIGTEHLLLGVLAVSQSLAAKVLTARGVTHEAVLEAVKAASDTGLPRRRRHLPFTPLAERSLVDARSEAVSMGHGYVGTEHILLAVRRQEEGLAARILGDLGVSAAEMEADVVEILTAA